MATPEIRTYRFDDLRGFVLTAKRQDDALRLSLFLWLTLIGGLRLGQILSLTLPRGAQ